MRQRAYIFLVFHLKSSFASHFDRQNLTLHTPPLTCISIDADFFLAFCSVSSFLGENQLPSRYLIPRGASQLKWSKPCEIERPITTEYLVHLTRGDGDDVLLCVAGGKFSQIFEK